LKTLIDIEKETWAKVKYFATLKEITVNNAVDFLLQAALGKARGFENKEIK
jgi:hypothetical protein